MNNQKGNATLLGVFLILMASGWSTLYLKNEAHLFKRLKSRLRSFTCMKEINGEVKSHIRLMERLNTAIDVANAVIVAGVVAPPAIKAAKIAKKAAQLSQEVKHFSYMKKLVDLSRQKCVFDPKTYITPYRHKGILSRDVPGRAKLRSKKWNQMTFGTQIFLKTEVEAKGSKTSLKTRSWEIQEALSLLK